MVKLKLNVVCVMEVPPEDLNITNETTPEQLNTQLAEAVKELKKMFETDGFTGAEITLELVDGELN